MPIYTSEQLAKVGTGEKAYSAETGKVYTFSDDKTYMFYGASEDITDVIKSIVSDAVNEKITSIYPVGSIYLSTTDTNPGTYLGGTWESYGQGRTLVGAGEGTDTNGTRQSFLAGTTGGEYSHTLSIAEMPSHTHIQNPHSHYLGAMGGWGAGSLNEGSWRTDLNSPANLWSTFVNNTTATNQYTGGSQAHNNVQPYIVCYMWKRVG